MANGARALPNLPQGMGAKVRDRQMQAPAFSLAVHSEMAIWPYGHRYASLPPALQSIEAQPLGECKGPEFSNVKFSLSGLKAA